MLDYDPRTRILPDQALLHKFFQVDDIPPAPFQTAYASSAARQPSHHGTVSTTSGSQSGLFGGNPASSQFSSTASKAVIDLTRDGDGSKAASDLKHRQDLADHSNGYHSLAAGKA
jgi:hypothetical protein